MGHRMEGQKTKAHVPTHAGLILGMVRKTPPHWNIESNLEYNFNMGLEQPDALLRKAP